MAQLSKQKLSGNNHWLSKKGKGGKAICRLYLLKTGLVALNSYLAYRRSARDLTTKPSANIPGKCRQHDAQQCPLIIVKNKNNCVGVSLTSVVTANTKEPITPFNTVSVFCTAKADSFGWCHGTFLLTRSRNLFRFRFLLFWYPLLPGNKCCQH